MTASEIRAASQQQHDRTIAVLRDCEQRVDRALAARQRSPSLRAAAECPTCRTAAVDSSGSVDVRPDAQDAHDAAALYQKCPKCGAVIPRGDYAPGKSRPILSDNQQAAHDNASIRSQQSAAAKADASAATAKAVKLSQAAQKSGDLADHATAAQAHVDAAAAHSAAAQADQKAADSHVAAANSHNAAALAHSAVVNEAQASGPDDATDADEPTNKSAARHHRALLRRPERPVNLSRFVPPNPWERGLEARALTQRHARTTDLSAARLAGAEAYREAGRAPDGYRIGLELRRLQAHPSHAIAPPPLPVDTCGTPDPYNQAALRAHQRRRAGGKKEEPQ